MSDLKLSGALGGIPDDMLQEAMAVKKSAAWKWAFRAAACLVVIIGLLAALLWPDSGEHYITGPGLLKVRAYADSDVEDPDVESVILEKGMIFTPEIDYNILLSYKQDYPISFHIDESDYPGMSVTIEVYTNAGIFYKCEPFDPSHLELSYAEQLLFHNYGQHFSVPADTVIYWEPLGFDYEYLKQQVENGNHDLQSGLKSYDFTQNPSFWSVIIWADDMIVGYCVVEIREINGVTGLFAENFSFEMLASVSFPRVAGELQNISYKYVQKQINQICAERSAS